MCKNPKHLAWATYSLLINNPIKRTLYILMIMIESLLILFYSFSLVENIHENNLNVRIVGGGDSFTGDSESMK